jgi:hypothetical protein
LALGSFSVRLAAGWARAVEEDVMGVDGVIDALGEGVYCPFEPVVFEGGDASAVVADEVVVVVAAGIGRLVAGGAVADVESLYEVELVQQLHGSVDAGEARRLPLGAQGVGDVPRGEAAVLFGQDVDHVEAGGASEVAGLRQSVGGVSSPGFGGHVRTILGSHESSAKPTLRRWGLGGEVVPRAITCGVTAARA